MPCHPVDRNQPEKQRHGHLEIECAPAVVLNRQVAPLRLVKVQVADSLSVVVCLGRAHESAIHKS